MGVAPDASFFGRREGDPTLAAHLFAVGEVARRKGTLAEAERLYRLAEEAADAEDAAATSASESSAAKVERVQLGIAVADVLYKSGRFGAAAPRLHAAIEASEAAGAGAAELAALLHNLGVALRKSGALPEAAAAATAAYDAAAEAFGAGHEHTLRARAAAVETFEAQNDVEAAVELLNGAAGALEAEEDALRAAGEMDAARLARARLAAALQALGELQLRHSPPEDASADIKAQITVVEGSDAADANASNADSAEAEAEASQSAGSASAASSDAAAAAPEVALELTVESMASAAAANLAGAVQMFDTSLGQAHPATGTAVALLASALRRCGRHSEALPLQARLLKLTEAALGAAHPTALAQRLALCELLSRLGSHGAAAEQLDEGAECAREKHGKGHPLYAQMLAALARTRRAAGDAAGAQAALRGAAAAKKAANEGERGAGAWDDPRVTAKAAAVATAMGVPAAEAQAAVAALKLKR